jgi:hypothetical protein
LPVKLIAEHGAKVKLVWMETKENGTKKPRSFKYTEQFIFKYIQGFIKNGNAETKRIKSFTK